MSAESVFNKDVCTICHTFHTSGADKAAHIEGEPHKKKKLVQDFISNEIGDVDPQNSDLNSLLCVRRLRSGVAYVGAEHIVELRVSSQEHDRFWICKVCNVADRTLNTVDSHLYSSEHVHNTWKNTPDPENQNGSWFDKFQERINGCPENEIWNQELNLILEFVHLYGPSSTTAFNYPVSAEVLAKQLETPELLEVAHYEEEVHDNHTVICCHECYNVFYKRKDAKSTAKAWDEHLATPAHQEALFFKSYLDQIEVERKMGFPPSVVKAGNFDFVLDTDGVAYSSGLALDHCVVFGADAICTLCFCVVPETECEKHFSSERHCENFLRSNSPASFVNCEYEKLKERRACMSAILSSGIDKIEPVYYFEASVPLPSIFRKICKPENRKLETAQEKKFNITGSVVFLCNICNVCFRKSTSSWDNHITSVEHFDKLIEWQSVQRDERSFLIVEPNLPKFNRKRHLQWTDHGMPNVQNYCEVGMDLVFYDCLEKAYICTCCYKEFPEDQKDRMHLHVRSLKHIQSALCTINPDFAAELLAAKSETAVKALVAEYLKFNPAIKIPQKIREFNPLRAFHLNFTKQIPRFLLRLAETEFTLREGYIKENRIQLSQGRFKTTNDTDCVCMTTALQMTNLVQIRIDAKEIIFFCLDCQMSFSVFQNSAETIWTEHLLTEMHWKRMNTIQRSQLDLTKLMDEPSRYQPKIIEQSETDGKKKLVWTWNTDTQSYQFVVQNKLTFDDVAHREHFNGIASFFCSLCCETFETSEHALTAHVFGFKHLLFYVIKYFPNDVNSLEYILVDHQTVNILSTRDTIRSFIAEKLRSAEFKNSKVRYFDGRKKSPQFANLKDFLDKEPTSFHVLRACKAVKIDNLLLTKNFSFATLHNLCPKIPDRLELQSRVFLHCALTNLLDPSIRDVKPEPEEDWIKPLPTKTTTTTPTAEKRVPEIIGPVVSKVVLGRNGQPIVIDTPVVNLPAIAPVPAPVIAPVPPPVNIVPVKVETSPMEISDEDEPKSRGVPIQNRRRQRSPPSSRRFREQPRLRSRSPIDPRGRRSYQERSPEVQSWRSERSEQPRRFKEEIEPDTRSWRSHRTDSLRDDRDMNYRIKRSPSPMLSVTPPHEVRARSYAQPPSPPMRRFREDPEPEGSRSGNRSITPNSAGNAPKRPPPGVDESVYLKNLRHQVDITPKTHVLPPVDLTKPPPGLPPMTAPPPNIVPPHAPPPPAHYIPGFGPPPFYPPPYGMHPFPQFFNPPPPLPGQMPMQPQVEPQIDKATQVMLLKMNRYCKDLAFKSTREELVAYLKIQGQDPIPETDPPLWFNNALLNKKNIIGADFLSMVQCFQEPDYETYLCNLCEIWTTVSDIFRHLRSTIHRVNYLQKRYVSMHAKYLCLETEAQRADYLEDSAKKIAAAEGPKFCKNKMRVILNRETIERMWPDVEDYIDNSWKLAGDDEIEAIRNIPPESSSNDNNSPRKGSERERSDRDRERDRERRDRDRRRSPGIDDRKYSSSGRDSRDDRRRSKSPKSRKPDKMERRRSPSPKRPPTPLWEKQTHIFSDTIERLATRPNLDVDVLDQSRNEKLMSLKEASKTTTNGFQQSWENNFREPTNPIEIEERKMSAAEKRMIEQQTEKKKREGFQKKLPALVLIRQEAVENKSFDRETINRICGELNVTPDDIFQEDVIEEAGKILGEDSVYVLTAVAYHYQHPLQPTPKILQEPPVPEKHPHAATLLAGIGMDKTVIANLLKKVAMAKQAPENEAEAAKRKRRRGGVKERNRKLLLEYRNRVAAGIDLDDEELVDDYDNPRMYADPYYRSPAPMPPANIPPQLPEDYQGPVGIKKIRPGAPAPRPVPRYEPEVIYEPNNDYYPTDYMYQNAPNQRLPPQPRQRNPVRSATGANALPVPTKGAPRMASSTAIYPPQRSAGAAGPSVRPRNPPPQQHGYSGSFVSDYDYFASDYGNERQFFTAPPKTSAAPPPPAQEEESGDWDAAEIVLNNMFK